MPQNIDLLGGVPFTDRTLKTAITRLQNETPTINVVSYATFANPTTTANTLASTTGQSAYKKLYADVDLNLDLTSNIAGAQTFTFALKLGDETVATSVVSVPDAINTAVAVRLKGHVQYTRTVSDVPQYSAYLIATPISTTATADVSTVTVVNTRPVETLYTALLAGDTDIYITGTASVGTATTTITVLGGRITYDNAN